MEAKLWRLQWIGLLLAALLCGCGDGGHSHSMTMSSQTVSPVPCSPASASGGPFCLQFVGSGYDIHVGQQFKIALVASDGTTVVAGTTLAAIPAAAFTVNLPQSMVAGVSYYVDYYADNSGDKTCTSPTLSGDHVWRSHTEVDFTHGVIKTLSATSGDLVFNAPHDDPFVTDPTGMDTCAQLNQVH